MHHFTSNVTRCENSCHSLSFVVLPRVKVIYSSSAFDIFIIIAPFIVFPASYTGCFLLICHLKHAGDAVSGESPLFSRFVLARAKALGVLLCSLRIMQPSSRWNFVLFVTDLLSRSLLWVIINALLSDTVCHAFPSAPLPRLRHIRHTAPRLRTADGTPPLSHRPSAPWMTPHNCHTAPAHCG